jgi:hypothetical protein
MPTWARRRASSGSGRLAPGRAFPFKLATELDGNLLKLKRALPLPAGATIAAKVLMATARVG